MYISLYVLDLLEYQGAHDYMNKPGHAYNFYNSIKRV